MNIKVQRQKPNRGEGAQGEMRLVIMSRGSWLYIKGGNQWHSLNLMPTENRDQVARRLRANLERNIRAVVDDNADGNADMDGTIMNPNSGTNSGAALDENPT